MAIPITPYWKLAYSRSDQLVATITQKRPSGSTLRIIKLWRYKWDTNYSGVGGENYKKLAEAIWVTDRRVARLTGGKASSSLRVKKLSRAFPRAYYYEVEMFDEDLETQVRRREYYIKGKSATFNFEITDLWAKAADDDPLTRFQVEGEGVELMHFLESLTLND